MPTQHVIRAALPLATGRLQRMHPTIPDVYAISAAAEPQQPVEFPRMSRQTQPNRSLRLPSLLPKQQEQGRNLKNRLDRTSIRCTENSGDAPALALRRRIGETNTKRQLRQTRATLHEIRPRNKKRPQVPTTVNSAPKLLQCAHVYSVRQRRKRPESMASAVDRECDAQRRGSQLPFRDKLMHPWQRVAMQNTRKGMKGMRSERKEQMLTEKSKLVQQPILIEESSVAKRKDTLQARSEPRKHTQSAWDWAEWAHDIDATQVTASATLCASETAVQSQNIADDEEDDDEKDDDEDMWWPASRGVESTNAEYIPSPGKNMHVAMVPARSHKEDGGSQKEARGRRKTFPTPAARLPALLRDSCMMLRDAECQAHQHATDAHTLLGSRQHHAAFEEKNESTPFAPRYEDVDFNCENHDFQSCPSIPDDAHIFYGDMDSKMEEQSIVANAPLDAGLCSSSIKEALL